MVTETPGRLSGRFFFRPAILWHPGFREEKRFSETYSTILAPTENPMELKGLRTAREAV